MDRLSADPQKTLRDRRRRRQSGLVLFGAIVLGFVCIKSFHDGWFEPRIPLPLNGQPALVFFTLSGGCQCQRSVVQNAEAQIAAWDFPGPKAVPVLRVDFSRRPDLALQYGVVRAPALVLLDAAGEVVWKQDVGLSDEKPLDLAQAQIRVEAVLSAGGR